jgi:hypothetical protein
MEYSKIYYISSNYRETGNQTSFKYSFQIDKSKEYTHVSVLNATIPNTYYNVQSGYNTFQLLENLNNITIAIPPGNYNVNTFTATLKSLLNSNSPNGWTYNIIYSQLLSKFIYSVLGNTSQPSVITLNSNLYRVLGFDEGSTNTFNNNVITSTNVLNFVLNPVLYIHSDIVKPYDENILVEINANNSQPLSYITYENKNIIETSKEISSSKNGIYEFFLIDNDDQTIDLNGNDFSFSIILF